MDEKAMRREVMIWLTVMFLIFAVSFFFVAYFMADRMYVMSKEREYYIVGRCFKYTLVEAMDGLKELTEHVSYDVAEYMASGSLDKLPSLFENLSTTGEIGGGVVVSAFGKYLYSSFEEIPSDLSGAVLMVIKDRKARVDVMEIDGEISAVAVVPVFSGEKFIGVVATFRSLKSVAEAAKVNLGGNFELVRWDDIPEISEELVQGKEFVSFRKNGKVMVYYDIYRGKYFIHWTERDERGTVMAKIFALVAGLSIPLFAAFLYLVNLLRRKIISNFVNPLTKMIDVLDDLVSTTSSSSQELAASSQELAASTKDLEEKGMSLNNLAQEMLEDLGRTLEFSENVSSFSAFLKKSLENLEKISDELGKAMQEIHRMGGLIQQIGERIVVLSINASIEGSRETIDRQAIKALADEIGNLSETTTERVSEIFASLQGAQEKIDEMNAALKGIMTETERLSEGAKKLHDMVSSNKGEFEKVSDMIEGIFSAIEEVNFASQNLAEAATELSRKSYEVQRIVDEMIMRHKGGEEEEKGGD